MLNIFRASAGTGKTHLLAKTFIKLLYKSRSDEAFSHILAVTFTKKATEEMKVRILQNLSEIARHQEGSTIDENSLMSQLLTELAQELPKERQSALSAESIKMVCNKALTSILHNYSHFSIVTLDSFFQKIVRSFLIEAQLNPDYDIDLNNDELIDRAITSLLDKVKDNENLRNLLFKMLDEQLEESGNFNVRKVISKAAKEFTTDEQVRQFSNEVIEDFKDTGNGLTSKGVSHSKADKLKTSINRTIREFEKSAKEIGNQGIELLHNHGLVPVQLKSGVKGAANIFNKLANHKTGSLDAKNLINQTVRKACEDTFDAVITKSWGKTDKEKFDTISLIINELNQLFNDARDLFYQDGSERFTTSYSIYLTACNLKSAQSIDSLTLVAPFLESYRNLQEVELRRTLTDDMELLHTLIGDTDAPFVYEKSGSIYESFLLDEFQDTSKIQWENIKPLLQHSLSTDKESLVVGDIKQAIYRWRNSDWNILSNKLESDLHPFKLELHNLDRNWRSSEHIVKFVFRCINQITNYLKNTAETELQHILSTTLERTYGEDISSYGKCCREDLLDKGYVSVKLIKSRKTDDFQDKAFLQAKEIIYDAQQRGYKPNQITILVRSHKEGAVFIKKIMEYRESHPEDTTCYDIISQDSLNITESRHISFILNLFSYATDRTDQVSREYCRESLTLWGCNSTILSDEFLDPLSISGVMEATEAVIKEMNWSKNEDILPFLQEFADIVFTFLNKNTNSLSSFVAWADENIKNNYIPENQEIQAIRLMTIHKAKGLENKIVIIPFINRAFGETSNSNENPLWISVKELLKDNSSNDEFVLQLKEFKRLRFLYNNDLSGSLFAEIYYNEKCNMVIDLLNLFYVAITRARDELYIISKISEKEPQDIKWKIGEILKVIFSEELECDKEDSPDTLEYSVGEPLTMAAKNKYAEQQHSGNSINYRLDHFGTGSVQKRIHAIISNEVNDMLLQSSRATGTALHNLFSKVVVKEDLEPALNSMLRAGDINEENAKEIKDIFYKAIAQEPVKSWFRGKYMVRNENAILLPASQSTETLQLRPDRILMADNEIIIVDYKFGEERKKKYHRQLQEYASLLNQMGYKNIQAYLWYFYSKENQIEPVTLY